MLQRCSVNKTFKLLSLLQQHELTVFSLLRSVDQRTRSIYFYIEVILQCLSLRVKIVVNSRTATAAADPTAAATNVDHRHHLTEICDRMLCVMTVCSRDYSLTTDSACDSMAAAFVLAALQLYEFGQAHQPAAKLLSLQHHERNDKNIKCSKMSSGSSNLSTDILLLHLSSLCVTSVTPLALMNQANSILQQVLGDELCLRAQLYVCVMMSKSQWLQQEQLCKQRRTRNYKS